PTLIAGIVTSLRVQASKRGKMAFVTLDDGEGTAEVTVYSEILDEARSLLREDQLLIVEAKVAARMGDDGQAQGLRIIADRVFDLATIRQRHARGIALSCNGGADAARLFELLSPFREGECPVVIDYRNHGLEGTVSLPDAWRVVPDDTLIAQLREWLAPENVRVLY
ncbi:MAG TPA: OB-fold nucleic acid binding domain-containing protein, partial [Casimicrobiaceae bacterium]|nr:OB-fold nucleic acid binding domain-containing protein [Casimicrobiaceae bacterium]